MSRSYKKTPRSGDDKDKFFKNYANRKLRRQKIFSTGPELNYGSYKKNFQQYDICDYQTILIDFEDFYAMKLKIWYNHTQAFGYDYPNKDECWKEFIKWYKRK